jgi:hypothetical protein
MHTNIHIHVLFGRYADRVKQIKKEPAAPTAGEEEWDKMDAWTGTTC